MPVAAEADTVAVNVMLAPVVVLDAEDFSVVVVAVAVEDVLLLLDDPQPVNCIAAMQNTEQTTKRMSGFRFISRTSCVLGRCFLKMQPGRDSAVALAARERLLRAYTSKHAGQIHGWGDRPDHHHMARVFRRGDFGTIHSDRFTYGQSTNTPA